MTSRIPVVAALAGLVLVGALALGAEGGTVEGNVRDGETGDRLLGANVWIIDTSWGAATDDQGNFKIQNVPPGTYDLKVFYVGYAAMVIDSLVVNGGVPTPIVVSLIPEAVEIKEIVVSAQRVLSTSAAILVNRKKAAAISDAISAEQIANSPDATSGDALARVTGISVHDDKFIFIRGMTDRYNGASINGVTVTSTDADVDKKSFAFDMIPANLLENSVVVKTMTPDKGGDLAGGVVELNTMTFPSARLASMSASYSYDSRSSTRTVLASRGGSTDWLGYDDGARALPQDKQGYDLARTLSNTWAIRTQRAPLNKSLSLSFGDCFKWTRRSLGVVAAGSYRNGHEAVRFVERPTYRGYPISDFSGARYSRSASWGLLAGLSYRVSDRHSLSLEADLTGSGVDRISASSGLPASGEFTDRQTVEWDQRSFALAKLAGDHRLPLGGLQGAWRVSWTTSSASEPDRKFVTYERGASEVSTMKENYRTWSDLQEHTVGLSTDLTLPLGDRKIKAGLELSRRERDFDIKAFSTDIADVSPENYDLLALPLDTIFEPENYGPGKFSFVPVTVFTGKY
ncbi:MAG: carboxypeptidase-like regulatory domain-containing protein, partial [bacterium]